MANIQIRKFQDEDAESVKEIFISGMSEHLPAAFTHALKQTLIQMVLVCTFCALLTSSKSFLLPVLAVTLLLAGGRQMVATMVFSNYIEESLKTDLRNISEAYLKNKDSCFWVAESDGQVVGTVACLPAENAPGCMELKRMSVRRSHRGMGIAKALCRALTDFTHDRGYPAVILYTSVFQIDAQKLYEHMGYQKIREFCPPEFVPKITNLNLLEYRLDLQRDEKH